MKTFALGTGVPNSVEEQFDVFCATSASVANARIKLTELDELGPGEWLLADLTKEIGVRMQNMHGWLRRGGMTRSANFWVAQTMGSVG